MNHREILKLVQSMDARMVEIENKINLATNTNKETTYMGRKSFNINLRAPPRLSIINEDNEDTTEIDNGNDKLDELLGAKDTQVGNLDEDSKSNIFEEIKEDN